MQDDLPACAICGSPLSGPIVVCLGEAQLVRCLDCDGCTYLPRRSVGEQSAIHNTADYFEHPYFHARRNTPVAIDRRCREAFARIGSGVNIESLRGERLLDVGCDTGSFLTSAAKQFGVVPIGIDVSLQAVQEAARKGIEAYLADIASAPRHLRGLPVITAIDLIEHVVDPRDFLRHVLLKLRSGGVAYLETPNIRSVIYRIGSLLCSVARGRPRATFERLFPPHHLQYFSRAGFLSLAEDCGFEVVRLDGRPLKFSDVATSLPIRLSITGLQLLDWLIGDAILICAVLRKP